jgi:hypothetical protein
VSEGKTPNRRSRAARPLSAMGRVAAASLKPLREGATEVVLDSQLFQSLLADALDRAGALSLGVVGFVVGFVPSR